MEKNDLILDLCSGLNGRSNIWKKEGYIVETVDLDKQFKPTYCIDVRDFKPEKEYKTIFASPPCTYFSFARSRITTQEERREGLEIVYACFDLIKNKTRLLYCRKSLLEVIFTALY